MSRLALSRWLVGHTARLVPVLGIAVLARIAGQLLGVALFVVAAASLARIAGGEPVSLPAMIGAMAGIALAKALLRYLEHYSGHWVAFTALQRLRVLFFDRLVPQAPAATTGRAGAELTERATGDIDRIEVFFAHTLPPAVAAVVVPGVALTWLGATEDPRLALAIAAFLAATVLLMPLLAGRASWHAARRTAAARGALAAHVGDDVQGAREVRAFGAEAARLQSLDRAEAQLMRARARDGGIQGVRAAVVSVLYAGALIAPLIVGIGLGAPAVAIVAALAVAVSLIAPTRGIDDFVSGLDAAFAATDRIRRIIDAPPIVRDHGAGAPVGMDAPLTLDRVTLRYPEAPEPVLREVSLSFPAATWSYLVGVSGSGKSSTAGLLLRGWDPESGTVTVGGADAASVALDALRRHVALVPQRPVLLSGRLAENLRLAASDADDDALRRALRIAALDDWVDRLDAPIGERGATVSGGQLQRMALARALAARPRVLVLDEALSQLDADTAKTVRERLAAQESGLTVIEITHRADLIPDEAPVTVIDAGRVVEQGEAGVLRREGTAFRRLEARV